MAVERQWSTYLADGSVGTAVDYDITYTTSPNRATVTRILVTNRTPTTVHMVFRTRQRDREWPLDVVPQVGATPPFEVNLTALPQGGYRLVFDNLEESWKGLDCEAV